MSVLFFCMASVNVVLPVFNREVALQRAVESVINQTHNDWTLIIVDDASTDSTYQIACSFADTHPQIEAFRFNENSGNPAKPRNCAMEQSNSDFIAFLDSDDEWHPRKLETQIHTMQEMQSPFSFTAYNRIRPDGFTKRVFDNFPVELSLLDYLKNTCIAPSTVTINRQKFQHISFPENYAQGEDFVYFCKLLRETDALGIKQPLTNYHVSHDAISSTPMKSAFNNAKRYWNLRQELGISTVAISYIGYAAHALKKRM